MERNDQEPRLLGYEFEPEAIILGGGDFPTHPLPLSLLQQQSRLVCCDGAANQCLTLGIHPWRVIGDGDSISDEARQAFKEIVRKNPDQETNDQTKAVNYLTGKGFRHIAILAATGKREDHTLGNISLLFEYLHQGLDVRIFTDHGVFIPCHNTQSFRCPTGTAVSIFAQGTQGMSSTGLQYPLYDLTAWWQGTLNKTVQETFTIHCQGDYLVFLNYSD